MHACGLTADHLAQCALQAQAVALQSDRPRQHRMRQLWAEAAYPLQDPLCMLLLLLLLVLHMMHAWGRALSPCSWFCKGSMQTFWGHLAD